MKYIVCATRGGAGSRAVQQKAIEYARERVQKLVFLFVIDVSVLEDVDDKLRPAVRDEMAWLGLALLGIAHQRAEDAGIESEIVIRDGLVRDEISRFIKERSAELLLLGAPRGMRDEISRFIKERSAELLLLGAPRGTTATIFGDDVVEEFASSLEEMTGVTTEIVRPLEIPAKEEPSDSDLLLAHHA
jgi:hypothetical protein